MICYPIWYAVPYDMVPYDMVSFEIDPYYMMPYDLSHIWNDVENETIFSVHVQQFAQYDETGFYVACKGAKWQHGKKGKKIMFKCE